MNFFATFTDILYKKVYTKQMNICFYVLISINLNTELFS